MGLSAQSGQAREASYLSLQPVASSKALTFISRTIRRWTLHHSSDKSLPNLAEMYNPLVQALSSRRVSLVRSEMRNPQPRQAACG